MTALSARFRYFLVILSFAGLAACGSSGTGPTMISVSPTVQSIAAAGQSGVNAAVAVQGSIKSWSSTSDAAFVTITSGTGTSSGTITYSVAANTTTSARTAHITITPDTGSPATLEVDQAGTVATGGVSLNPTTQAVGAAGQTGATVAVTLTGSAKSWSSSSDSSFVTITAGTGTASGTLTYTVAANTTTSARTAHITVTPDTGAGATLEIDQAAALAAAFTFSATAAVSGGDCAVKAAPGGASLPAQIFCSFDPSSSAPASSITSYTFTLVEGSETLGTGTSVTKPLVNPLTQCVFGSNTATPLTIKLSVTSPAGTATTTKTVNFVKSGVC